MRFEHAVHIDAPAEVVWRLTADVARWPAFLPTVQQVRRLDDAPLGVGSSARLKQPAQPPAVWTVTALEPQRAFSWRTTRFGLDMTASHLVEPDGAGCRNTVAIDVAGRGSRLFGVLFGGPLRKALRDENAGFKAEAERLAGDEHHRR